MQSRVLITAAAVILVAQSLATLSVAASAKTRAAGLEMQARRLAFDYRVEIPATVGILGPLHVFVPVAGDDDSQRILSFEVDSPIAGEIETESDYGNRYWHAVVPAGRPTPTTIEFRYDVERSVDYSGKKSSQATAATHKESMHRKFLRANSRVVVGDPILDPLLSEIRQLDSGAGPDSRARAIYDWVVDNVEYKKVGTGWGNGDTFWACTERYGNCTDFHSLFISLARTEGIPARFEMGFPIPMDRSEGEIGGYHCWVEFWIPEIGWIPIDASEAFKDPSKRELYYGTHPADRLQFSTGRDLRLGPDHKGRPLNYFIYPYAEVDGVTAAVELKTTLRYRDFVGTEQDVDRTVLAD